MNYRHEIILDNLNANIRRHREVIVGHDAVHPDRNACGGVGGCALMMTENETEQEVIRQLEYAAREGLALDVTERGTSR